MKKIQKCIIAVEETNKPHHLPKTNRKLQLTLDNVGVKVAKPLHGQKFACNFGFLKT